MKITSAHWDTITQLHLCLLLLEAAEWNMFLCTPAAPSPGCKSGVVLIYLSVLRFVCCIHTFLPTSQISSVSRCPRGWRRCELRLTQIKTKTSNIFKILLSLCAYSLFHDKNVTSSLLCSFSQHTWFSNFFTQRCLLMWNSSQRRSENQYLTWLVQTPRWPRAPGHTN